MMLYGSTLAFRYICPRPCICTAAQKS